MKKVILGLIIGIVISTGTIYAKQINDTIEIAYNNIKISVFRTRVHSERYGRKYCWNHSYMRVQHMSLLELFHRPLENVWIGMTKQKPLKFCQPFSYQEVMKAQDVIKTFFDDFAENNYTEMKKVLSEPFSQYDISNGVYGMKSATLSGIEYIEESSDWSTDTLIFNCTFDNVEFTPNASNNNGNNKGACYILVHKDRDTYTISNFVSGL